MFPHAATDIAFVMFTKQRAYVVCVCVWERIYIIIVCECRTTIRFTQLGKRMPFYVYISIIIQYNNVVVGTHTNRRTHHNTRF